MVSPITGITLYIYLSNIIPMLTVALVFLSGKPSLILSGDGADSRGNLPVFPILNPAYMLTAYIASINVQTLLTSGMGISPLKIATVYLPYRLYRQPVLNYAFFLKTPVFYGISLPLQDNILFSKFILRFLTLQL